jgi:hypothetical protein
MSPLKTTLLHSTYPNMTDCPKLDADFCNPEIINIINFHEKMFQGYRFFREIQRYMGVLTF